ncbi:MAG: hypothetical protein AAFR61_06780 [Bacteroidota bacterium]
MRPFSFLLVYLLSLSSFLGQGEEKAKIQDIRQQYAKIESLIQAQALQQKKQGFACDLEPYSATVIYHYDSTGIYRVDYSEAVGDHGGKSEKYYLWEGELFFMYREAGTWGFDGEVSMIEGEAVQGTVDHIEEERFYFDGKKLLRCLHKAYSFYSRKDDNPDPATLPNKQVDCYQGEEIQAFLTELLGRMQQGYPDPYCP